jgi:hypothetical protein
LGRESGTFVEIILIKVSGLDFGDNWGIDLWGNPRHLNRFVKLGRDYFCPHHD